MKNGHKDNYLDYVFAVKEGLVYEKNSAGEYIITMENSDFTNRLAQMFFKKPKESVITLEGLGSFVSRISLTLSLTPVKERKFMLFLCMISNTRTLS